MEPLKLKSANKLSLSLDLRVICGLLLIVIAVMLALWRPWQVTNDATSRTVQVTGETTVKAEPDQYVFYPSYQFTDKDKTVSSKQANDKSTELVAQLKKIGIEDKNIKTSITNYNDIYYNSPSTDGSNYKYNLMLTVTVGSRDRAQQIQDFLATTSPQGAVTPTASFSETKRKQVESQARDEATKDARAKAEQNAKNLGFKIGKVKTVTDGQGFSVMPYALDATTASGSAVAMDSSAKSTAIISSPVVQPGQNDLTYSVTVIYYVK